MKKLIVGLALILSFQYSNGQVLISLIFGDKLNSDKIEFGLDGGLSLSTLNGVTDAKRMSSFNLGFYFDFKLKNPSWMVNTGVIVKSPMGAKGLPVYSLDNADLDTVFTGGSVKTKLSYFSVPVMMKYLFRNHIYAKAGIQLGWRNNAKDEFTNEIDGDELIYEVKTKDQYHPLDAGLAFGLGYRLMKGYGINLGVQYYLGLVDISLDDISPSMRNDVIYFNVGIPIGKGKSEVKKDMKKTQTTK